MRQFAAQVKLEERRVGVQILADSEKLKKTFGTLGSHLGAWRRVVQGAHRDLSELDRAIAESLLALGTIEAELESRPAVEELQLDGLVSFRVYIEVFLIVQFSLIVYS